MSTLSSSSTDAEVEAAYDDTASYREDNSPTSARLHATACRIMARRRDLEMWKGDLRLRSESLREEGREADKWADANDTSTTARNPRVTKVSFTRGPQ